MVVTWAKITTQFQGFHRYADAPSHVEYLRNLHRHMFHVTLWIEQFHSERDVEYISVKDLLESYLFSTYSYTDAQYAPNPRHTDSCETMAHTILTWALGMYPNRKMKVEVTEDGENGSLVEM